MKKFNEHEAKEIICKMMDEVSFRKFGNAFRKHIDPHFSASCNTKAVGGLVCNTFLWSDLASYIIGEGGYSLTEEQFNGFMAQVQSK